MVKTEFDTTSTISTYLVALVISDFDCLQQTITNIGEQGKVDVRVCARSDAIVNGQLNYTLEIATNVIKYFEDYYGAKYPLSKSGMIILFALK